MTAQEIIRHLNLDTLPVEGGYYSESYKSAARTPEGKNCGSAIYYMHTPDTFSLIHKLDSDEVYHFYMGDPVELLLLYPDGHGEVVVLGHDLAAGQHVQFPVPGGVWQGSRLMEGGSYGLMGTTMAPGYDHDEFVAGDREALLAAYPDYAELIDKLI